MVNIQKRLRPRIKMPNFGPALTTDLAAGQQGQGFSKIVFAIAIGALKINFLQGNAARIKAGFIILQSNMNNNTTRLDKRTCRTACRP